GCCGELASALPRYGTDWRVVRALVHGNSAGGDVAGGVPEPAGALAVGDSSPSRDDQPGAEFRIRAVRSQDSGRGSEGSGPEFVAGGAERSGAGPRGSGRPIP